MKATTIPTYFWGKRLHSLAGFGLVVYIIFHLVTNSQAALWIGADGQSFIHSVNSIHETPYLLLLELFIIALPIVIHATWGLYNIYMSKCNSYGDDGKSPYLPEYGRNHAYTWQRITAWMVLVGIIFHVVHMRFIESPISARKGSETNYIIRIDKDPGIYTVANRLNTQLLDTKQVQSLKEKLPHLNTEEKVQAQNLRFQYQFVDALESKPLRANQLLAVAPDFGTAELLMLRETFKSPVMMLIYTIFVLAACFHAFNGLWSFLITWGVTLNPPSQRWTFHIATFLMAIVAFCGLAAIFGTYWFNLRQ